jgi:peptidoglycan hydrolase-like protein with peptidoglycan-binding domain
MYNRSDVSGWADYPDQGVAMGALIGQLAGLNYNPNLADVGHGAAYNPGSIADDAAALNFLGFLPDVLLAQIPDSFGQGGQKDLAAGVGAFDLRFRVAVTDFQDSAGLVADGFIGPNTRRALKAAVDAKNAREPASPVAPGVTPGGGGASPVAATTSSNALLYGGLAVGLVALGYAAWKFI